MLVKSADLGAAGNDEIQQIADILDCIADITYCTVCACMQTQQQQQLKQRDPNARPPSSNNPMAGQEAGAGWSRHCIHAQGLRANPSNSHCAHTYYS